MQNFMITEEDVLEIARQTVAPLAPIQLVAVNYNWGPPVSGRTDRGDFLQIWAVARTALSPSAVRLLGTYGPYRSWSNAFSFRYVRTVGDHQLYLLDEVGPQALCEEFVVEMEAEGGALYYDNNGGPDRNYRLIPYKYWGASAVTSDGVILQFDRIVSYRLLRRSAAA